MAVLFAQYWEISHGRENEYSQFIREQYIPRSEELGLKIVGGYYVAMGAGPRVISVAMAKTLDETEAIIGKKGMRALHSELNDYVYNYDFKVMAPTGRVPEHAFTIQKGVWKFNQYWDPLPGKIKKYSDFITTEYLPLIEKIGLVTVAGGWNVVLGKGQKIIADFSTPDPESVGALFDDQRFIDINRKLRTDYVMHYGSRLLCPTESFGGPELTSLERRAR